MREAVSLFELVSAAESGRVDRQACFARAPDGPLASNADQCTQLFDFPISSWPPVMCSELTRGEGKNFGASGDRYSYATRRDHRRSRQARLTRKPSDRRQAIRRDSHEL